MLKERLGYLLYEKFKEKFYSVKGNYCNDEIIDLLIELEISNCVPSVFKIPTNLI